MGYPPLEQLLPKSGYSIYKLIRMASNRATELADGKRPLVTVPVDSKTTTVALEEVRAGMVVLKDVADQFRPAPEGDRKKKGAKAAKEDEEPQAVVAE